MNLSPHFGLLFTASVVGLVAVFNFLAFRDAVPNNTISAWITHGSSYTAAIPFALGAIIGGHWASRDLTLPPIDYGPFLLLGIAAIMVVADWLSKGCLSRYPYILWFLFGIAPGAILWPMDQIAA